MNVRLYRIVALLIAMLLLFTACGGGLPETEVQPLVNGTELDGSEQGIVFSYPADWTAATAELLEDPAIVSVMTELLSVSEVELQTMLQSVFALFYDLDGTVDGFTPNLNLTVGSAQGVSASRFASAGNAAEAKSYIEAETAAVFADFAWIREPEAMKINGNSMLCFQFQYSMQGIEINATQAMIVGKNDQLYTFTYTASNDSTEAWTLLLSILGTITLQ